MRSVPMRGRGLLDGRDRVIGLSHPDFFGFADVIKAAGTASGTWPSAERAVLVPFRVSEPIVVKALGWLNGSAAGGNHDIGIYTSSGALVISSGSTAGVNNSVWQFVNITDTSLAAGFYYLAKAVDSITANRVNFVSHTASLPVMEFMGAKDSASDNFPLPNPFVSLGAPGTFTRIPSLCMLCRESFA